VKVKFRDSLHTFVPWGQGCIIRSIVEGTKVFMDELKGTSCQIIFAWKLYGSIVNSPRLEDVMLDFIQNFNRPL
jgi:hypothetical protein